MGTLQDMLRLRTVELLPHLILAALMSSVCTPAHGAVVAAFDNGRYVDTDSARPDAESDNVRESSKRFGHSINRFTKFDATSLRSVLDQADVLLVPELELRALDPDLEPEALELLREFVSDGGGIVINGTGNRWATDLLNLLFGWSLTVGGVGQAAMTADGEATRFAGGRAELAALQRTRGLEIADLPRHAVAVYAQELRAPVVRLRYGSGRVVYLGWDWFDAEPLGREDGGWIDTLGSAYEEVLACRDQTLPDQDGDGIADECDDDLALEVDPCVDVDGQRVLENSPKLIVRKVGSDKKTDNEGLLMQGPIYLPLGSVFADLDPLTLPLGLNLERADGGLIESLALPTVQYQGEGTSGWVRTGPGKWLYRDETATPVAGVREAIIKNQSGKDPQRIRVRVIARNGSFPVKFGDEPLQAEIVVGDPAVGQCARTSFVLGDCLFGRSGRRVICQD